MAELYDPSNAGSGGTQQTPPPSTGATASSTGLTIVAAQVYLPFGEQIDTRPGQAEPEPVETIGFIGERYDADAGLQFLNARYYDPALGMFLQPDWFEVIEPGVGTNRYAYSGNNPANNADPGGNYYEGYGIFPQLMAYSTHNNPILRGLGNVVPTVANAPATIMNAATTGLLEIGLAIEPHAPTIDGIVMSTPIAGDDVVGRGISAYGRGSAALVARLLDRGVATNRYDIWDQRQFTPIERGNLIEEYLAVTDYRGWYNIGAELEGFSPAFDFNLGSTWVSLKTVDTTGTGWQSRMRSHIDELARWGSSTSDVTRVLDVRVQPGGSSAAESLVDYGEELGIQVRINEF